MKLQLYYLPFFIFFFSSCKNFLSEKRSCNENPEAGKLLIFIGEKIEITEMEPDHQVLPYVKIKARYKVLDVVCGNYNKDEITFIAYDHYGLPPFTECKNSILYINMEKDTFYHEMYLYDPLYKTKEGKWATPYSFMYFYLTDSSAPKMPPRRIEYAEEVSFDIKGRSRNWVKEYYPSPFYIIKDKKAIAAYGNYVEEVVDFQKRTSLKARGYYGTPDSTTTNKVKVQDVTLADIKQEEKLELTHANKTEVVKVAYVFFDLLRKRDSVAIRQMSFDSVICSICEEPPRFSYENNLESLDSFLLSAKKYLPFSQLELEIQNKVFNVSVRKFDISEQNTLTMDKGITVVYSVVFTIIEDFEGNRSEQKHKFEFLKMKSGYKFYGLQTEANRSKYVRDY